MIHFVQGMLLIVSIPFFKGLTKWIKAWMRGQTGPSPLQTYYDWWRLFTKGRVLSSHSSPVTRYMPSVGLAAALVAMFIVPVFQVSPGQEVGSLWLILFLMLLVKVTNTLIGLDAGSSFGGMGSSRELFVGFFAEPVMALIIAFLFIENKSFNLHELAFQGAGEAVVAPGRIIAAMAFFILILAENARMPVDNPETHLELTMIHEAMVLDVSGPDLAYVEMTSTAKLVLYLTILINGFYPVGIATTASLAAMVTGVLAFIFKLGICLVALCINEVTYAKFRLLRVPELLGLSFALALTALAVGGLV